MTHLVNNAEDFADQALDGLVAAHSGYVRKVHGGVVRATQTEPGQVAVVIGGGTGHYPAFPGWVGPIEPVQSMLDKVLPHANYWHVKNYLRDEDPATGAIMTFPVPMDQGLINYRSAIRQALDLGYTGAFLTEHYGSDGLGVCARNREYIRGVLAGALA